MKNFNFTYNRQNKFHRNFFSNFNYVKVSNKKNSSCPPTPKSVAFADFAALTTEEQERQQNEMNEQIQELTRVEEEIYTLRTVLALKVLHSSDLKGKGIKVLRDITNNMNQRIKNVKESTYYQNFESKFGLLLKRYLSGNTYRTLKEPIQL